MSTPVEIYHKFDFEANEQWKSHHDELFPQPRGAYLEKFKRKWYNSNIDKELDIDYDGLLDRINVLNQKREGLTNELKKENSEEKIIKDISESDSAKKQSDEEPQEQEIKETKEPTKLDEQDLSKMTEEQYNELLKKYNTDYNHKPLSFSEILSKSLLDAELFAVMLSFIVLFMYEDFKMNMMFILAKSLLVICRKVGRPRWSKEWFMKLVTQEALHNVLMVMLQFFLRQDRERLQIYTLSSVYFHHILGVFDYLNFHKNMWYKLFSFIVDRAVKKGNRKNLMLFKQFWEMSMLFFFCFETYYFDSGILFLILYFNFLRMKYLVNDNFRDACVLLNDCMENSYLANTSLFYPFMLIYRKSRDLLCFVTKR